MFSDITFNNFKRLSCIAAPGVHSSLSSHPAVSSVSAVISVCYNSAGLGTHLVSGLVESQQGEVMLKYILLILSVSILTGCSEFKVISSAAMRELRAEGMNVEQISYNYNQKLAAIEKAGGVMMAKAGGNRAAMAGNTVGGEKKMILAKAKRVKGLWEKGSR